MFLWSIFRYLICVTYYLLFTKRFYTFWWICELESVYWKKHLHDNLVAKKTKKIRTVKETCFRSNEFTNEELTKADFHCQISINHIWSINTITNTNFLFNYHVVLAPNSRIKCVNAVELWLLCTRNWLSLFTPLTSLSIPFCRKSNPSFW